MTAALIARAPGSTITSFSATFSPGEIRVNSVAAVPAGICGSATVTIEARVPMQICKDAMGSSAIVYRPEENTSGGNICLFWDYFWSNFNVGTVADPLGWQSLVTVSFAAGGNDTFYGTDLDLDNAFAIIGRSSTMDNIASANGNPRPEAPGKCPGVP